MKNGYASLRAEMARSNKRLKLGDMDSEERREAALRRRQVKQYAEYAKRVQQEEEDRNRYIIPEFQDLEDLLTG